MIFGPCRRMALPLERDIQARADHVALVGLAAEVDVVEHPAAQVFAELGGDAGSSEHAVAVRVRGFEVEGRSAAAVEAGVDVNAADCWGGFSQRHQGTEGSLSGNAETPPCSPWLCERENADCEKAPTERRPPKVVWEPIRLGKVRLLSVGLANGGGGAGRE